MNTNDSRENISRKVVRGGLWMFALHIVDRLFNFVRTIVLARLLMPKDFGLFGIGLIAIMTLTTFSKTGFHGALIQKKDDIKDYLDTAWTVHMIRGVILTLILFLTAPYISSFFNEPSATPLLRVLALSELFVGITNPGVMYFERDLVFQKLFIYEISGTIFDIVVSIVLAFMLRNVWALVYGLLARRLIQLVLSFLIVPQKIRLRLDVVRFKELFDFGKYIFLSSILNFLLIHGSQAFVGKVLGAVTLGFYVLAFRISDLPTREVITIVDRVTFPAYSKVQEQILKLKEGYSRILQMVSFILIPVSVGLFVLAKDFTELFLGEKWMAIVPALKVLVIWGGMRAINVTSYPLFNGVGRPVLGTKIRFVQILFLGAIIYPFSRQWNLLGICLAVFLSELSVSPLYFYSIRKIINIQLIKMLKMFFFPAISALSMAFAIFLIKSSALAQIQRFLLSVIIGSIIYICILYILERLFHYGLYENILTLKRIMKHPVSKYSQKELACG